MSSVLGAYTVTIDTILYLSTCSFTNYILSETAVHLLIRSTHSPLIIKPTSAFALVSKVIPL